MNPIFYHEEYKLLVCSLCKCGCVADEVDGHVRAQHKQFNGQARRAIVESCASYTDAIKTQEDITRIKTPNKYDKAIEWLEAAKTSGLKCRQCGKITGSNRAMRAHVGEAHGWSSPRQRGGQSRKASSQQMQDPWETGIRYQRFFTSRGGSKWFEVEHQAVTDRSGSQPMSPAIRRAMDRYTMLEDMKNKAVEYYDDKKEPNAWLGRTGWAAHFEGIKVATLQQLREKVDSTEEVAAAISSSIERIVKQAEAVAKKNTVGLAAMFEANRTQAFGKPTMPLADVQEKQTVEKYRREFVKVVVALARMLRWKDDIQRGVIRLTTQQQMYWDELQVQIKTQTREREAGILIEENVDRWCRLWLQSLIEHQLQGSELYNGLLAAIGATAMRDDGAWSTASETTQRLSAIIRIARVLAVQQCWLEREETVHGLLQSLTLAEAEEEAPSMFTLVRDRMRRYMIRTGDDATSEPTPMDWLLDLRTYGFKITYTTPAHGEVWWDGQTIHFRAITLHMSALCNWMQNILAEAREALAQAALCGNNGLQQLPRIPWAQAMDDPGRDLLGFSFLQDRRNAWVGGKKHFLLHRVNDSKELHRKWINGDVFRDATVRQWVVHAERLRERLLLLMHMTSMPARGTEIIGLRFSNTANGGVRNIIIHDRSIAFVTTYHKGFRHSAHAKLVYRFLPREVGELLVWYLWIVLPFWQSVQGTQSNADEASAFLWSRTPTRATPDGPPEPGEEPKTWSADRLRRIMLDCSERLLGQPMLPSEWRHIVIATANRFIGRDASTAYGPEWSDTAGEGEDGPPAGDDPLDLQAGHSTYISNLVYGRQAVLGQSGLANEISMFRRVSTSWHAFLGFQGDGVAQSGKKRSMTLGESARDDARRARFERLRRAAPRQALHALLGPQAQFRGQQEEVMASVQGGETPILYIAGTGEGKSLVFMLPALCSPDGVTVVIVPLLALEWDLARRCEEAGINATVWEPGMGNKLATLLFVTPESACSPTFGQFIQALLSRGDLDRVVVDECHVVLDARAPSGNKKGFRERLLELKDTICQWGVQIVFLTATLSPMDETDFLKRMGVEYNKPVIFRGSTSRRNIRYATLSVARGQDTRLAEDDAVTQLVRTHRGQRIIIYTDSKARADAMGVELGCYVFHADVGSPAEKIAIYKAWTRLNAAVVIATSALSLGVDAADVRIVIHLGLPRSIRDFCQESGRAGRDGLPALSIIVYTPSAGGETAAASPEKARVLEFVRGDTCRRLVLDKFMDGRTRTHCDEAESACDVCQPTPHSQSEGLVTDEWPTPDEAMPEDGVVGVPGPYEAMKAKSRHLAVQNTASRANLAQDAEELGRRLADWSAGCVLCRVMTGVPSDHEEGECPPERKEEAAQLRQDSSEFTRRLRSGGCMANYSGCFDCKLPPSLCSRYTPQLNTRNQFKRIPNSSCTYPGLVATVYCAFLIGVDNPESHLAQFAKDLDHGCTRLTDKWLGMKRNFTSKLDGSNLAHVVLRLLQCMDEFQL